MTQKILQLIKSALIPDHLEDPSVETFKELFNKMDNESRIVVSQALKGATVSDMMEATNQPMHSVKRALQHPHVAHAIYTGLYLSKQTDAERQVLKTQATTEAIPVMTENQVAKMLSRNENYIKELAELLPKMTGDAKRDILKQFIAYGTQSKIVEPALYDDDKVMLQAPIYGLADAKIAMSALRELNLMDNEYGEKDRATSSMETHAERVRRLAAEATEIGVVQRESWNKHMKLISKEVDHGKSN